MAEEGPATSATKWDRMTAFATVALAVIGFSALVLAGLQVRELREEAKVQHLLEFIHDFDGPARSSNRKALALKRIDKSQGRLHQLDASDPPDELTNELDFCEDLGLLTHRGYLNRHDVWNDFGYWLFVIYTDARPYLDVVQKNDRAEYWECSNLVESLRPIEIKESTAADEHPSEDDIYSAYSYELDRQAGHSPRREKRSK
jgi:hypothetical protein